MAKKKAPVADESSENRHKKNKSKKTDKVSDVEQDDQLTTLSAEDVSEAMSVLKDELEVAIDKADHNWNECLSAKAELENTRRRMERDIENAHKFAVEKFIQDLLPVIDSMEMGLNAATEEGADVAKLRQGTELTHKIFTDMIAKFGVECIAPEEETFNPEFHQAMSMQESADVPSNTILAVMQKGYLLNGRLIRPAMVIVSKAKPSPIDSNIDNPSEADSLGANIDEKA